MWACDFWVEIAFNVYPNPATNQLNISSPSIHPGQQVTISIINLTGELMKEEIIKWKENEHIDINKLLPGIYFLLIKTADDSRAVKFIKD